MGKNEKLVFVSELVYVSWRINMALESLLEIMTPPVLPVENVGDVDWINIEELLGVGLPADYKQFINVFGTGEIGEFLLPFNPFSKNENLNLLEQIKRRLDFMRKMIESFGEKECPYPLYPHPSGLLPWGCTGNGDMLFWLMDADVNNWAIVVYAPHDELFEHYKESMTSFLEKLITGDIVSQPIPNDFINKESLFLSIDDNN